MVSRCFQKDKKPQLYHQQTSRQCYLCLQGYARLSGTIKQFFLINCCGCCWTRSLKINAKFTLADTHSWVVTELGFERETEAGCMGVWMWSQGRMCSCLGSFQWMRFIHLREGNLFYWKLSDHRWSIFTKYLHSHTTSQLGYDGTWHYGSVELT
jgi:hypothetical protein